MLFSFHIWKNKSLLFIQYWYGHTSPQFGHRRILIKKQWWNQDTLIKVSLWYVRRYLSDTIFYFVIPIRHQPSLDRSVVYRSIETQAGCCGVNPKKHISFSTQTFSFSHWWNAECSRQGLGCKDTPKRLLPPNNAKIGYRNMVGGVFVIEGFLFGRSELELVRIYTECCICCW